MKLFNILLTITLLCSFSCNSQNKQSYDEKAIALNNRASELIITKPDSALILLNQATEIDPDYYLAHNNKINLFISRGEFDKAIESAEKGVKAKPDLAESVTMLGMLYDYKGQTDKAREQYTKALEIYNRRLENSDKNEFDNKLNRALTLLLLEKLEEGQKEIERLLQEYPNDSKIQMLVDFDKQQYLNNLFRQ